MARARSPNRDKAFEIYKNHNGNIANREIARTLGISEKTISGWKAKDNWNDKLNGVLQTDLRSTPKEKRKKGGQPNNKNSVGCGAPKENKNAEKHGFFSKYLPDETKEIIEDVKELDPIEILWGNIQIQYAAIIRAQRIMYVESKEEMIKELKKKKEHTDDYGESTEVEYEFQFAWDRQATFLQAQSRAMKTLESMINSYDEMIHKNWDSVTEEQKTRIEVLKSRIVKDNSNNNTNSTAKLDSILVQIKERNKNE